MPAFTIYEKPGLPLEQTVEEAVIIKHKFSYFVFLVPGIWMLAKRLWWALAAYVIVSFVLAFVDTFIPLWASMLVSLFMAIWIAAEAPNLQGWALERRGFQAVGLIFAENLEHCEARYINARLSADNSDGELVLPEDEKLALAPLAPAKSRPLPQGIPKDQDQPVLGLFPSSENA
ncbi:MAG: DUF2628 domain-containing protein [Cohaesibacter sp.]|jgi:hypothetical protein|nr:DUF2628 domain-containing protein [Cohaesibacter sp.]